MASCGYTLPGTAWHRMGRQRVKFLLRNHFGRRQLHIGEQDDLEQKVEEIMRRNLGDFSWSIDFSVDFVARLLFHGFVPICTRLGDDDAESEADDHESSPDQQHGKPDGMTSPAKRQNAVMEPLFVLLPKLHRKRCVVQHLQDLRVDRGARKRSRRFHLTIDAASSQVIQGCLEQHGESWLYPPVREAFVGLLGRRPGSEDKDAKGQIKADTIAGSDAPVVMHSVELWADGNQLVAGELGYSCGCMYTSLTGFHRENGAGVVQLLALAGLLLRSKFKCWDLGMNLEYKAALGAQDVDRADFVSLQRELRADVGSALLLATQPCGIPAMELISSVVRARTDAADNASAAASPTVQSRVADRVMRDDIDASTNKNDFEEEGKRHGVKRQREELAS